MEMLMLKLMTLTVLATLSAGLPCFYPCTCEEDYMDCARCKLNTTLDVADWLKDNDENHNLRNITFDSNNLVHVRPFPAVQNLRYLSFTNNRIQRIENGSFHLLQNLTELDLSNNGIVSPNLTPDIFWGMYRPQEWFPMEGLETLRLSGNELHTLKSDVFTHIPHLKVLYLERNPFYHLDLPTQQALTSLLHLEVLDLSYTHIGVLPQYMLHTLKNLRVLNLIGNSFTIVPEELQHSHTIEELRLSGNPIFTITADNGFPPKLNSLKILEMNWMSNLTKIERGALSSLTSLEEFYCSHNHRLNSIDADAFRHEPTKLAPHFWPPIKTLHLRANNLSYLDEALLGQWEDMDDIDIEDNDWMCDCNNQWLVSKLEPIINRTKPEYVVNMKCTQPEEMKGKRMFDLQARHYHMRCLDLDGNHPERDGMLLIGVLVGVLLAVPATMALLLFFRHRLPFLRTGPAAYSRAFYSPTDGEY